MPLVTVTRKPVTLQGYQLTTPTDMLAALDYLKTRGYSGTISLYKNGATPTYTMQLVADAGNSAPQLGAINDWIVIENDTIANVVSAAKATVLYQLA